MPVPRGVGSARRISARHSANQRPPRYRQGAPLDRGWAGGRGRGAGRGRAVGAPPPALKGHVPPRRPGPGPAPGPARSCGGGGEPRGGSGPLRTDGGGGERRARGSKAPSGRAAIGRSALSRPSRCLRRGVEGAARRAAALCEPGRRRGRAGAAVEARGGAGGTEGGGRRRGAARGLRGADAGLRSGEPRGMGA